MDPPGDVRAGPATGTGADPPSLRLLTVGHSNHPLAAFLDLLRENGVAGIADVRRFPRSARHPHFSREQLAPALAEAGIAYLHLPELGGFRETRRDSAQSGFENPAFLGYADHMESVEFAAGLDHLIEFVRPRSVAVMCAEALPAHCHRRLLADALVARGLRVEHVVGPGAREPHVLTPGLRIEGGRLLYGGWAPRLPGL